MTKIIETIPELASYQSALTAIAILILAVLIQSVLQAPLAFQKGEQSPGMPLKGDHSDFSFRVLRTYMNSVECLPILLGTAALAIIIGVNAAWVNWLVGLHVFFRLVFWGVYYSGTGKVAGGPRTISFVGAWLANIILAGMVLFAAFGSF